MTSRTWPRQCCEVPKSVYRKIKSASVAEAQMTLLRALDEYGRYKAEDVKDNAELETRLDRIEKDLIPCLVQALFRDMRLESQTWADANRYRDLLLARMTPSSVQRNIGLANAALNFFIVEHGLMPNQHPDPWLFGGPSGGGNHGLI